MLANDVVVIGGGPAGLQAALTLGRMHRTVLVLDSGDYRNSSASHMHNLASHDGRSPADYRTAARADLAAYRTVRVASARAVGIEADDDAWIVSVEGAETVTARAVLLATGLRDTLPEIPGIDALWGGVVAHCPYCHGHEFSGMPIAIVGSHPHVPMLVGLMTNVAASITVLANGGDLDDATAQWLQAAGLSVRLPAITSLSPAQSGARVELADGSHQQVAGVFVAPTQSQSAPFADDLGLEMLPSGSVRVDEMGRTSRAGIYAAGDMAHVPALPMPLASVLTAAAAGLVAGAAIDRDLVMAWVNAIHDGVVSVR